jgi:hypothetical protein
MAQTGYTPISIYYSATSTNVPTAGNLVAGELAINTADGKLFYKDSAGVVQVIGTKGGVGSSSTTQVLYNSSGLVVGSANMTFSGTALTLANDASISGLTVGKGGGTATNSTAVGLQALNNASSTGTENSAFGRQALYSLTSGGSDVAVGNYALYSNTTGNYNTALGYSALQNNTTASLNTASGYQSMYTNTTGQYNTAYGANALKTNNADANTAVGSSAMFSNTTGANNVAIGITSLYTNTTGSSNTALGYYALAFNTTASNNTAVGYQAGYTNTVSSYNTFIGQGAGYSYAGGASNTFNTFVGSSGSGYSVTTGTKNCIFGNFNGNQGGLDIRTASNYIVLSDGDGNPRAYWNSVGTSQFTANVNGDVAMYMNNTGNSSPFGFQMTFTAAAPNNSSQFLFYGGDNVAQRFVAMSNGGIKNYSANNVNLSDESVKKDITLAGNYLDKICAIPVKTFLYKDQTDTDLNLGVIAQDVQAVAPELTTETDWGTKENPDIKLSVYESDLMFAMMKAIQELKAEFDAYKAIHP